MSELKHSQEFLVYTGTGQAIAAEIQADLVIKQPSFIKQMGVFQMGASGFAAWALWERESYE